jgi:hypothetical protein
VGDCNREASGVSSRQGFSGDKSYDLSNARQVHDFVPPPPDKARKRKQGEYRDTALPKALPDPFL